MSSRKAHFDHPEVRALTIDLFDDFIRSSETSGKIQSLRFYLEKTPLQIR